MESLQSYGIYFIISGGLLVIAGLIVGYLATLRSGPIGFEMPKIAAKRSDETQSAARVSGTTPENHTPVTENRHYTSTGTTNVDVVSQLERLSKLREQGVLSQEQFDALKQQILEM
jgi:hypothetical protein